MGTRRVAESLSAYAFMGTRISDSFSFLIPIKLRVLIIFAVKREERLHCKLEDGQ